MRKEEEEEVDEEEFTSGPSKLFFFRIKLCVSTDRRGHEEAIEWDLHLCRCGEGGGGTLTLFFIVLHRDTFPAIYVGICGNEEELLLFFLFSCSVASGTFIRSKVNADQQVSLLGGVISNWDLIFSHRK